MPAKKRNSEERKGDEIAGKIQEPKHWSRISGDSRSYLDNPEIDIIGKSLQFGVPRGWHGRRGFPQIQAVFKIGVFVAGVDRRGGGANSEKDGESYQEKEDKDQLFVTGLCAHLRSAAEQSSIKHEKTLGNPRNSSEIPRSAS